MEWKVKVVLLTSTIAISLQTEFKKAQMKTTV